MTIEDRYYTPSIEEFHVGFEYELKSAGEKGSKKWKLRTIERVDFIGLIDSYSRQSDFSEKVRVKYLDREDIESLGFTCTVREDETIYRKENSLAAILHSGHNTHRYLIYNGSNEFKGYIKNKSELKRLLIQLGIK